MSISESLEPISTSTCPDILPGSETSSIAQRVYTFTTEDGTEELTYWEYLNNPELRKPVMDRKRYRLILGRKIFTYGKKYVKQNAVVSSSLAELQHQLDTNALQFFDPSGQEAIDMLNAHHEKIQIFTAPNRMGKTATGIVKILLKSLPTNKNWPIFTEHGVKWQEFTGPKIMGYANYKWPHHKRATWAELRKWIPAKELGPWWPKFEGKGRRIINWKDSPEIRLDCGSLIYFYVYEMDQDQYESNVVDEWGWDEQGHEFQFDGGNERTRTVEGNHTFYLTPHKLKGRPDTGASGWLNKLISGEDCKGYEPELIGTYQGSLLDVPDWVYPEVSKWRAFRQHVVEPEKRGDRAKIKEGRARFYGEPHRTADLVYSKWDREFHVIDPIEIGKNWTLYRAIDHGRTNPTACIWAAVPPPHWKELPWPVIILFREFYKAGNVISENAKSIIERSGNKREQIGKYSKESAGITMTRFKEVFTSERYKKTVFDPRTFARPDEQLKMPLSDIYKLCGLRLTPGSGKNNEAAIPIVEEWFAIDDDVKHPFKDMMGCPRIFVFRTMPWFIKEIEHYVWKEQSTKKGIEVNEHETPRPKDDHLMDALKYLVQEKPRWYQVAPTESSRYPTKKSMAGRRRRRDPITKY